MTVEKSCKKVFYNIINERKEIPLKGTRDKAKIHVNFMKHTFLCSVRQNKTYDKK